MLGKYFQGNKKEICRQDDVITTPDECKVAVAYMQDDCSQDCNYLGFDCTCGDHRKINCDCEPCECVMDLNYELEIGHLTLMDETFNETVYNSSSPLDASGKQRKFV